jgi:hypothetical protein
MFSQGGVNVKHAQWFADGNYIGPAELPTLIRVNTAPGMEREEVESIARLIAAAPDLLAALQALTDWGRDHTSPKDPNSPHALLVAARAAIAQAMEGRQ